eukprot:NODE_13369_length_211_cov_18.111111_g11599_i0.p2 GENE.NODE_13369_length_211_cov_18.111111_g11599_i0~~NODE_13369_length_211_cov_18.111111_g11599_i0.p2  ORF type:complete len:59 (+),score=10.01 NODE_13369_length_211_cov_18.111111_g11599_i0:29-178(+)
MGYTNFSQIKILVGTSTFGPQQKNNFRYINFGCHKEKIRRGSKSWGPVR